jgi:hypothetical protein
MLAHAQNDSSCTPTVLRVLHMCVVREHIKQRRRREHINKSSCTPTVLRKDGWMIGRMVEKRDGHKGVV